MQEGNEEPFNIRLHLAKDILTIQEQDVICVSGEPFYSSVSSTQSNSLNHLFIHQMWLLNSNSPFGSRCTEFNLEAALVTISNIFFFI